VGLLHLFFSPSGRITRLGFWLGLIGLTIIGAALGAYALSSVFGQDLLALQPASLSKPAAQLLSLGAVILLYPLFAITAKRLHDRGRGAVGACLALILALVPIGVVLSGQTERVGGILSGSASPFELVCLAIFALLILFLLFELGLRSGQPGPNRYGPDPKNRDQQ
jgi:uncharacterized membrane protein YhaH (DUF805 family)